MKLIFAGTPQNAALALEKLSKNHEIALVITREDAAVGRSRNFAPSAVAKMAAELGLEVHKTNRFGEKTIQVIAEAKAELAIVVAFGAMIPEQAMAIIPWWNIHFSLLPMWRGASPLQQSMIHDKGIGITIFKIEAGLDTGPVISKRVMSFEPTENAGSALERFTIESIELLKDALIQNPQPISQTGEASSAPKITRADARLNFNQTSLEIDRRVRAFNPEPIAWTEQSGNQIRIHKGATIGNVDWSSLDGAQQKCGDVVQINGRVIVCCGNGTRYELHEVQPAGKKVMKAGDWFRGIRGEVHFD